MLWRGSCSGRLGCCGGLRWPSLVAAADVLLAISFSNLISRFFNFLSSTIAAGKSVCAEPTQVRPSKRVRCPRLPSGPAVDGLAPACLLLAFEHFELRREPADLNIIWHNSAKSLLNSDCAISPPPSKQTKPPAQPSRAYNGQQPHLQLPDRPEPFRKGV